MFLESPIAKVKKSKEETFNFLTNLENFQKLMPENIDKFKVINENRFLFALKGMPEIVLERKDEIPNDKLVLGAASEKLAFTLTATLNEVTNTTTEVKLSFNGDFNAMMAMMIKTPITNFINTLANNLGKI